MAKLKERTRAINLRKQEMSYSQIKKIVKVSKGTLSCWLRNYPLSKKQIRKLRDRSPQRIERFRQTMQKKRERRINETYEEQKKKWLPLSKRELFLAGLFLYWGEGRKGLNADITVTNTDPQIIKFYLFWLTKILKIPKKDIRLSLHLYNDMDIKEEHRFWNKLLDISLCNFNKPYIKKSSKYRLTYKGGYGHGTCRIYFGDVLLKEKIMMAIKAIAKYYTNKLK